MEFEGSHRDLLDLLAELRHLAGGPSFRKIADRMESKRGERTSHGHINQIFTGKKIPSGDTAESIAKALRGSPEEQRRAREHAEAAATHRDAANRRRSSDGAEVARELRQQSSIGINITVNQTPAAQQLTAEMVSRGAHQAISVDPPVHLLPPLLHGRHFITSEIVDQIATDARETESPRSASEKSLWVLHGMGGIGKSAIALLVADHCAASGMDVFWVSADDSSRLTAGMREIALRGARTSAAVLNAGSVTDAAWNYLESMSNRWLLVFDAADDPAVVTPRAASISGGAGWIRPSNRGAVLVTSRLGGAETWGRHARLRKVLPLTSTYGARIVVDQLGEPARPPVQPGRRAEIAAAESLSDRLGGLPLALRAAGRYLARIGRSGDTARPAELIQQYSNELNHEFNLIDRGVPLDHRGQLPERDSVIATWRLSLRLLVQSDASPAISLLSVLACMAPAPLPLAVVSEEEVMGLSEEAVIPADSSTRTDIRLLLVALNDLALIQIHRDIDSGASEIESSAGDISISLHRSVRDSIQFDLLNTSESRTATYFCAAVNMLSQAVEELHPPAASHDMWGSLAPHVLALLPYRRYLMNDETSALLDMAVEVVYYLKDRGEIEEAVKTVQEVLTVPSGTFDQIDAVIRRAQVAYGSLLRSMNDMNAAERVLREAANSEDQDISLAARRELGQLYGDLGRHIEAENEQRELLHIYIETAGGSALDTLVMRAALATTLAHQGCLEESESEFRVVVAALGVALGREHDATLTARANRAGILLMLDRADEAIAEMESIIIIRELLLGADHPEVWALQVGIAWGHWKMGNLTEARSRLLDLVERSARIYGVDGPVQASLVHNSLSQISRGLRQFEEAKRFALRAVLDLAASLGVDNPQTIAALGSLTEALTHTSLTEDESRELEGVGLLGSDVDDRPILLEKIVEHVSATVGDQHIDSLETRIGLYYIYKHVGDDVRADAVRDMIVGHESLLSIFSRSNVRRLVVEDAERNGDVRVDAAVAIYRQFLSMQDVDRIVDLETILVIRHELGGVLYLAGRDEEARAEYAAVLEQTDSLQGANHPDTVISFLNSGLSVERPENPGSFIASSASPTAQFLSDSLEQLPTIAARMESLPQEIPSSAKNAISHIVNVFARREISDFDTDSGIALHCGVLCIKTILEYGPTHHESLRARINFGHALLANEDLAVMAEAFVRDLLISCITSAGDRSPEVLTTQRMLVEILYESERVAESKVEATALLQLFEPGSDEVCKTRAVLARILLDEGDLQGAAATLAGVESRSIRPKFATLRFDLADALGLMGLDDEAIEQYGRALVGFAWAEGAFCVNALTVAARIWHKVGDEPSQWSSRPWFELYRKLSGLFQALA